MVEWIDLDELLDKDIGEIREMLAREDADKTLRSYLIEEGWIEEEDYDCDEEDDDKSPSNLSPEEEELAFDIYRDIRRGDYGIDAVNSLYDINIVERVKNLLGN